MSRNTISTNVGSHQSINSELSSKSDVLQLSMKDYLNRLIIHIEEKQNFTQIMQGVLTEKISKDTQGYCDCINVYMEMHQKYIENFCRFGEIIASKTDQLYCCEKLFDMHLIAGYKADEITKKQILKGYIKLLGKLSKQTASDGTVGGKILEYIFNIFQLNYEIYQKQKNLTRLVDPVHALIVNSKDKISVKNQQQLSQLIQMIGNYKKSLLNDKIVDIWEQSIKLRYSDIITVLGKWSSSLEKSLQNNIDAFMDIFEKDFNAYQKNQTTRILQQASMSSPQKMVQYIQLLVEDFNTQILRSTIGSALKIIGQNCPQKFLQHMDSFMNCSSTQKGDINIYILSGVCFGTDEESVIRLCLTKMQDILKNKQLQNKSCILQALILITSKELQKQIVLELWKFQIEEWTKNIQNFDDNFQNLLLQLNDALFPKQQDLIEDPMENLRNKFRGNVAIQNLLQKIEQDREQDIITYNTLNEKFIMPLDLQKGKSSSNGELFVWCGCQTNLNIDCNYSGKETGVYYKIKSKNLLQWCKVMILVIKVEKSIYNQNYEDGFIQIAALFQFLKVVPGFQCENNEFEDLLQNISQDDIDLILQDMQQSQAFETFSYTLQNQLWSCSSCLPQQQSRQQSSCCTIF